jgi:hypothetical protein
MMDDGSDASPTSHPRRSRLLLGVISARRIVWSVPPKTGFGGTLSSIDFPIRGQYLLVGTGTTVPSGIKKYLKKSQTVD